MPDPEERLERAREEGHKLNAVRAGIYCRLSVAAVGDTTKVDDQERICRDLADRLGWDVAEVYQDNNRSAWQDNRKRKQWDRMVADVEAGKIAAIVVYHGDRLLRTQEDLLTLINLAKTRGIKLASPTGTRDLGNYDDQFVLEIEASMAKRESANISRRRKAQYDRWRRDGRVRPGGRGGRAFGFETDGVTHKPHDRCVLATRELTGEIDVIREMAARVLAGESVGSIARDVSARGWRTPAGHEFSHTTIRKMLARPRYAGLMPLGLAKAAWEPVLDRETWEEVCAQLEVRAKAAPRPSNAHRWLLSGIAECSECHQPLQINSAHKRRRSEGPAYRCVTPGCRKVHRRALYLDAYITGRTVRRLNDPAISQAPVPETPGLAAELLTLTERRAEAEQVIASYADRPERLSVLARALDSIDDRIAAIRAQVAASGGRRILAAHAGITREQFETLPLATRRALIAAAYHIEVLPTGRRGPGFDPDSIRCTPLGISTGGSGGVGSGVD